jgi:hypothetical protein
VKLISRKNHFEGTIPIMASLNHRNLIWFLALNMSLCLIVHSGFIHRPIIYNEDLLAMIESNGLSNNDDDNSNRNERYRANFYQSLLPFLYDDNTIRQMINHNKNAKRSKLNLHTNLNLPRYLRTLD